ncbi:hypothetical protein GGTG_02976 [Gaeumannomyces tritici R3-111a-1]|uniref:Uncharacterized protein n=1 Tax=Gaeumannomyces tritici (strain R3-111a-1) TaxID=644352 RepID=J3NNX0_GAET3|nr:hypothetical protein GGTG_02976 [Gaeumannomyces tritici R3-111a-1]EJT77873.1 hypothetical protein GGTG_02976 [Gaeumannomyces tritici R3-111a-1]
MSFPNIERAEPTGRCAFSLFNQVPQANRPGDTRRRFWTRWIPEFVSSGSSCTKCESHECWGYTMVRTSHHDDAKFARAVEAVRRPALVLIELDRDEGGGEDDSQVDETICVEITTDQPIVRERLQDPYRAMSWHVATTARSSRTETPSRAPTSQSRGYYRSAQGERESDLRGLCFVLMDRETIDHLAAAPTEGDMALMTWAERARVAWDHWIKVVSTTPEYDEEGNEADAVWDYFLARRRIRVLDFVDVFL